MIFKVLHTFKDEILIPVLAISSNLEFLCNKGDKLIVTSDNVQATVKRYESVHILSDDATELVRRLYNTDVYSFMRKWYSVLDITSMGFLYMKLQKIDDGYGEDN